MSIQVFRAELRAATPIPGPPGPKGDKGDPGVGSPGPQGVQGIQGPAGPMGTGIELAGNVPTVGDLPSSGVAPGEAWLVEATGDIHVWDDVNGWANAGHLQGPPGATGPQGIQGNPGAPGVGSPGPQGAPGATGATGPAGPQGIPGAPGSPGAAGSQGIQGVAGAQGVPGIPSSIQNEGALLTTRSTLNFVGAGVNATDDAANNRTVVTVVAAAQSPWTEDINAAGWMLDQVSAIVLEPGGAGITFGDGRFQQTAAIQRVQDEGIPMTLQPVINFQGSGVSVSDDAANNRTNVVISGGGAGGSQTPWESDIEAAGHQLKNASVVQVTNRLEFNLGIVPRWSFGVGGPETGGNTGSFFYFNRFDDAGGYLSSPFYMARDTGIAHFEQVTALLLGVPTAPPSDANIKNGSAAIYEVGDSLVIRLRTSTGALKTVVLPFLEG